MSSTLVYALNGVLEYVLLNGVRLDVFFLLWSVGTVFIAPFLLIGGNKSRKGYSTRGLAASIAGSALLVVFNVTIFLAFKTYLLSEIYPLIALSSLVFFFLDVAVFKSQLSNRIKVVVPAGIVSVILGVYLAGGTGWKGFNLGLLPFVFAVPVFTGIGYYMLSFNLTDYGSRFKSALIVMISTTSSLMFFALNGGGVFPGLAKSSLIAATGALYLTAVHLEMLALRLNESLKKVKNVAMKNYINNFTYLDTVLVLIGSVAIGSYTITALFGGALIVAGVIVISMAKEY